MEQGIYTVYKHTFPNGKVYIGITSIDVKVRWQNGRGYMKRSHGKYHQPRMAQAILKYGWENIKHEILYEGLTKEKAEQKEIELIAKYKSNDCKFGYNVEAGGTWKPLFKEIENKIQKEESISKNKKFVRCIETGIVYWGILEAASRNNIAPSILFEACGNKNKHAGGLHWERLEYPCDKDLWVECVEECKEEKACYFCGKYFECNADQYDTAIDNECADWELGIYQLYNHLSH